MFNISSEYIRFRKINTLSNVKGYNTLTFTSDGLNSYLNNSDNLSQGIVINKVDLISQIESD